MLVAVIVDEVTLGMEIMNAYRFLIDLRAVSYTHLDVYKRQAHNKPYNDCRGMYETCKVACEILDFTLKFRLINKLL